MYSDGVWCQTVGCGFKSRKPEVIEAALEGAEIDMTQTKPYDLPELNAITKEFRGIKPETFSRYGVGSSSKGVLVFPYYKDGFVVGHKQRDFNQAKDSDYHFQSKGDAGKAGLFGTQAANGSRVIIITEGEFDALAANQMTGYPAVSVFNASSAASKVKANLQWLESFDTIYVCMDNDSAGRESQAEVLKVLKAGKAKGIVLPLGFKDANQMLESGKNDEFKKALWAAQAQVPKGVVSKADMVSRTMKFLTDKKSRQGIDTGYEGLNELVGGWRGGELHTFVAGTGIGKSTVTRNLCFRQINKGVPTLYIPLEDTLESSVARFGEMKMEEMLIRSDVIDEVRTQEAIEEVLEHLWVFEQRGLDSLESIVESVAYIVREHDIRFVVLDHITALANSVEGSDERKSLDRSIEALKMKVALEFGITVVVVSHMARDSSDKDDNMPSLSRIKGASSIAQYSDTVFGVSRPRGADVITVATLKQNRLWGKHGNFKLTWDTVKQQLIEETNFDEVSDETGTERRENIEVRETAVGQLGNVAESVGDTTTRATTVHKKQEDSSSSIDTGNDDGRVRPSGSPPRGSNESVHAGLQDSDEDRKDNLHRGEGRDSGSDRPNEVHFGKRVQRGRGVKARIPAEF